MYKSTDSTLLTGLTDTERIELIKEYVKELGGQVFTATDPNGNRVDVKIAEHNRRFINQNGRRVRVTSDLSGKYIRNKTKQEAISLVDELITTGKRETIEPSRYSHGFLDDNGRGTWEKWSTYLEDKNGNIWKAILHVANANTGENILYDIDPIIKQGQAVQSATSPVGSNNTTSNANSQGGNSHSDRDPDSLDTRTLLSNALLDTAQNDQERKYIADYQEKIQQMS